MKAVPYAVIILLMVTGLAVADQHDSDKNIDDDAAGSHSQGDMAGSHSQGSDDLAEKEADEGSEEETKDGASDMAGSHSQDDAAGSGSQEDMAGSHSQHNHVEPPLDGEDVIYTCPMHPQIRQSTEGRCPICGMELVPAAAGKSQGNKKQLAIDPVSRRLAGIRSETIIPHVLTQTITAVGSITFDESKMATIPAWVSGRIEALYADYTGVEVKKGDHLAVVYSPDLYAAQVEYLSSRRTLGRMGRNVIRSARDTQQELLGNARTRLKEFGMSDDQIKKIGRTGKAESRLEIFAPIGGTVIEKPTSMGQYIKEGQTLFRIADLSTVWLMIDVFPEDANLIHYGQIVTARIRSAPNVTYKGRVAFVSPVVDSKTRTIRIRVEIVNDGNILKPGDYAKAELEVPVSRAQNRGKIYDPDLAGKYISPMHPQYISDKPGKCPVCGMDMIPAESFGFTNDPQEQEKLLAVPRDAVLQVGNDAAVFVESKPGLFEIRSVKTGITIGDRIVVLEGISNGETVAVDGVFLIDSQMQLSGKVSLMDVSRHETGSGN